MSTSEKGWLVCDTGLFLEGVLSPSLLPIVNNANKSSDKNTIFFHTPDKSSSVDIHFISSLSDNKLFFPSKPAFIPVSG
jgi:hypothetical protein